MGKTCVKKKSIGVALKTVHKDTASCTDEDPLCTICFECINPKKDALDDSLSKAERSDRQEAHLDCCSHTFHVGCIKTWFKQENTCPLCKKKCNSIRHVKKNCKRKETTTHVDDKRQRPDHHGSLSLVEMITGVVGDDEESRIVRGILTEIMHDYYMVTQESTYQNLRFSIVGIRGRTTDRNYQGVYDMDPYRLTDGTYFFQMVPESLMYNYVTRSIALTLFVRSSTFRVVLLRLIKRPLCHNFLVNNLIRKARRAFNIIERAWNHMRDPNAQPTHPLSMWMDAARLYMYGYNRYTPVNSDSPLDIDNLPPRPFPQDFTEPLRPTFNRYICEAFARLEGRDVEEVMRGQGEGESNHAYLDDVYVV